MVRKTLSSILLLAGATAQLCAQEKKARWTFPTRSDAPFNMHSLSINQRHKAWIGQDNTMTVELNKISDYQKLQNLEALLAKAREDLAFVADTIRQCPECSYRVDYRITDAGMKNYRVQRYEPKGTFLYEKENGVLKPYKPEPDTLRIVIRSAIDRASNCQVTLVLNRFANIDSLLAQHGKLNSVIDSFIKKSKPKNLAREERWPSLHKMTIFAYRNYKDTSKIFYDIRKNQVVQNTWDFERHRSTFNVQANIGAGFIRDKIAPVAELGITYILPGTKGSDVSSLIGLYVSGYFGFEKDAQNKYTVNDNWFLNAELGDDGDNQFTDYIKTTRLTVGVGYLISQKGNYFQHTTMKLFMNIRIKNGITLSPEVISTNNFKQYFPGLTLKIF